MNLYFRMLLLYLLPKKPRTLSMWDTSRTAMRVVPTDLDLIGHVNNGKYLTMMDLGRVDLMRRSGFWKQLKKLGWYPVVAGQFITYRRSLKLWQKFEIHTRLLGVDARWIYIEQNFVSRGKLYAHAVIRARFLKRQGGSVEISEIAEAVGGLPENFIVPQWIQDWSDDSTDAMKAHDTALGD